MFPTSGLTSSTFSSRPRGKFIWSVIRRLVLADTVYHIWIERNNKIFKNKRRTYETMAKTITDEVCSRLKSFTRKTFPNVAKAKIIWRLPMKNENIATQHPP